MKKGIIFIALIAAFAISFVLLLNLGARANHYSFWIGAAKTDFRTDD